MKDWEQEYKTLRDTYHYLLVKHDKLFAELIKLKERNSYLEAQVYGGTTK